MFYFKTGTKQTKKKVLTESYPKLKLTQPKPNLSVSASLLLSLSFVRWSTRGAWASPSYTFPLALFNPATLALSLSCRRRRPIFCPLLHKGFREEHPGRIQNLQSPSSPEKDPRSAAVPHRRPLY
jgi:hypothetical protein